MTTATSRTGLTDNRGFSLIEVLVVIAVMALLATLLVPSPSRGIRTAELMAASGDLRGLLTQARALAIRESRIQIVVADQERRLIWMEGDGGLLELPATLSFELVYAKELAVPGDEKLGRIAFYPDGSSTGGEFRLFEAANPARSATVTIDWLVGVADVSEDQR